MITTRYYATAVGYKNISLGDKEKRWTETADAEDEWRGREGLVARTWDSQSHYRPQSEEHKGQI